MLIMLAMLWCLRRMFRSSGGCDRRNRQRMFGNQGLRLATMVIALVAMFAHEVDGADGFVPRRLGNHGLEARLTRSENLAAALQDGSKQHREGTSLPPTPGRIVLLGRRWVFMPSIPEAAGEAGQDAASETLPSGRRILSAATIRRTEQGDFDDSDDEASASSADGGAQWVLLENLMLQRIVHAVRSDSIDNKWIVTGKITEYFDDNYLVLESAKRSSR